MNKVLYPGSFDPITKGHMNIIEQASQLFDEVVIAILQNSSKKNSFFTIEERIQMLKELYSKVHNVKVVSGSGAAVDIAMLHECKAIIRGLRGLSDYDYEVQLAQINKDISNNKVNTICLSPELSYNQVKDIMKNKYNVELLVYGKVEVMIMKYCPLKLNLNNCSVCKENNNKYYLVNNSNDKFRILHSNCITSIMNCKNTNLIDEIEKYKELGIYNYRIDLLDENKEEVGEIINKIKNKISSN